MTGPDVNFAERHLDAEFAEDAQKVFGVLAVLLLAVAGGRADLLLQQGERAEIGSSSSVRGGHDAALRLLRLLGLDDVEFEILAATRRLRRRSRLAASGWRFAARPRPGPAPGSGGAASAGPAGAIVGAFGTSTVLFPGRPASARAARAAGSRDRPCALPAGQLALLLPASGAAWRRAARQAAKLVDQLLQLEADVLRENEEQREDVDGAQEQGRPNRPERVRPAAVVEPTADDAARARGKIVACAQEAP